MVIDPEQLDRVRGRAMHLREQLGRRVSASWSGPSTSNLTASQHFHGAGRVAQSHGSARELAATELCETLAGDPLFAVAPAIRATSSTAAPRDRRSDPGRPSLKLDTSCCLQVSVGTVSLSPQWANVVSNLGATLRYAVPVHSSLPAGSSNEADAEDVVMAACRAFDESRGVLTFKHTSTHAIQLTATTLPELASRALVLELLLGRHGVEFDGSEPAAVLGIVSIDWHNALFTPSRAYRASVDLLQSGHDDEPGGTTCIGKVNISISLHPGDEQDDITAASPPSTAFAPVRPPALEQAAQVKQSCDVKQPYDVKLRVQLGDASLTGPLHGLKAVLKLGPLQEVAAPVQMLRRPGVASGVSRGRITLASISSDAVWQLDPETAECLSGPAPQRVFLQLWRNKSKQHGSDLLALARIPLEGLLTQRLARQLCQEACSNETITILDDEIEVRSAATGAPLGFVEVKLQACLEDRLIGISHPRQVRTPPKSRNMVAKPDVMEESVQEALSRLSHALDVGEHHIREVADVLDSAARDVSARRQNLWCTRGGFSTAQVQGIVEADPFGARLVVAAWSSLGIYVSAPVAVAALRKLAQLSPSNLLRVPEEDLAMALTLHKDDRRDVDDMRVSSLLKTGALRADDDMRRSTLMQKGLARAKDDNRMHMLMQASQGSPAGSAAEDDMRLLRMMQRSHGTPKSPNAGIDGLQSRLFEIITAHGFDVKRAFDILDQDDDGFVCIQDYVSMLEALDVPVSEADLDSCAVSMVVQRPISQPEFEERYSRWMLARAPEREMTDSSSSECLDLPGFVVFATLDKAGRGDIAADEMLHFVVHCLGLSVGAAMQAVEGCDLGGRGRVTYRDFRRYLSRLDRERFDQAGREQVYVVGALRKSVRILLDVVDQPADSAEQLEVDAILEDVLKQRGRSFDAKADIEGFKEVLEDLRLPSGAAGALVLCLVRVNSAVADTTDMKPDHIEPTYRDIFKVMRRSLVLLRGHLDALYGKCMAIRIDLRSLLDFALRREDQMLSVVELKEVLESAGVNVNEADLEELLRVMDPHDLGTLSAPQLTIGYQNFRKRHGALLTALASNLSKRGLSPDELFARATHARSLGAAVAPLVRA